MSNERDDAAMESPVKNGENDKVCNIYVLLSLMYVDALVIL